ncbi:MAG: DUF3795 domain-containing protein [Candidatus Thorarchaeota archaeon]
MPENLRYTKKDIIESIAYCGLICKFCHLSDTCDGCKSTTNSCGKYLSEEGCFQHSCCQKKGLKGCWECQEFPCDKDIYSADYDPKIRAFARCIKEDGVDQFIQYVLDNNKRGLDVSIGKDYDNKTEKEVLCLLRTGNLNNK